MTNKRLFLSTLFLIFIATLCIETAYGQPTDYEKGTVFLSDAGGGNITIGHNITANTFSNAISNQARFTNFTMLANGSWANIGFRNSNVNNTMNITGVDSIYVRFDAVIANNTVIEFYSPNLGEPDVITGGNGTVWVAPTLFITMNVSDTVILEWSSITLASLTASDSRIGINVTINIDANITYVNGTAYTIQPVLIQGVNSTHQGGGIWRINATELVPGVYNYTLVQTSEGNLTGNLTVIWDLFNLEIDALFTEVEVGFNTLIFVLNGSSVVDGHPLQNGDTATINGVPLTWNTYMSRLEGTVSRNTPAIEPFNVLNSFNEATFGVTAGNITSYPTITWTTSSMDQILPFLRTGDWPGVILEINFLLMGEVMFWTFFMAAISLAIYSYAGAEVAVATWILGWGIFGPVIQGQALTISLIMIVLAGGIYIAKFFLDRRTSI